MSVTLSGCVTGDEKGKVNPYPFETAKIVYLLEGNIAGTQTVYIKGDFAAHMTEAVKTIGENSENLNWLYLEAGPVRYEIDLNAKQGQKSTNPIYEGLSKLNGGEKTDYLTKLAAGVEETAAVPASKGEKEVAGKPCRLYDVSNFGEICVWNGIPLYSKLTLAGGEIENTMTAQSVETDVAVDDNVFAIPLDVTVTDLASI